MKKTPKFVPIEVLVTGSKITLTVFKLEEGARDGITKKERNMWRKYRCVRKAFPSFRENRINNYSFFPGTRTVEWRFWPREAS